jgi:hypothetical protein
MKTVGKWKKKDTNFSPPQRTILKVESNLEHLLRIPENRRKVSMHVMASNPFREFTRKETLTIMAKQLFPLQSIMEMEKRFAELRLQELDKMTQYHGIQ